MLTRERLDSLIAAALMGADDAVRRAWERIRIEPQKWQCSPWGDQGGGFWVVAELDGQVLWFNDIEHGFNLSEFTTRGVIARYGSNQSELAGFLASLPEAVAAEAFARARPAAHMPAPLHGPGRIVRRQTTYWTLEPDGSAPVRVHFTGKQETSFHGEAYAQAELAERHPLLLDYDEAWMKLFVSCARQCPPTFASTLAKQVTLATGGWRDGVHYLGVRRCAETLADGFGCLMNAPGSLAQQAAESVRAHGANASLLPERPARPGHRVLLLGRSFVVARAFRFE